MTKYVNSDLENAVIIDRESDQLELVLSHLPGAAQQFILASVVDDSDIAAQISLSLDQARTLRDLLNSLGTYLGQ